MRFAPIPALMFAALRIAAQTPAPADPSFHVAVNLVQVDAEVTDSKGHHVNDLKSDDFEILEDGKPQKITNFSWIDVTPPAGVAQSKTLRKDDVRRSMVLMLDDAGMSSVDLEKIRGDINRFVDGQVQPGDLVAVTASRGGMGFYSRFTSDKRQMHDAVTHLAERHGWLMCDVLTGPTTPAECEPPNPVGFLTWAIQGLQDMPGRKAVVLFSTSFAAPPSLVELANRAGVVIYVIDTVGVYATGAVSASTATPSDPEVLLATLRHLPIPKAVIPSDAPYRQLAKDTGGLFLLSAPGKALSEDLGKVIEDMNGYYLIGYQPDRKDFEPAKGRPAHHDIQVRVRRKGLTVRARNGFLGVPDPGTQKAPLLTTHDYLQTAMRSPFDAGTIRMQVTPLYAASQPDTKTKLRHPSLHTVLEVDGNDLRFADGEMGKKKLTENVLVAVFNEVGTPVASAEHAIRFDETPEETAKIIASGLHAAMDVRLPGPGQYQVRAAVRDEASGAVGSASAFLEVPDFNKPEISLSSIELSAPRASPKGDGASWTEYTAGSAVHFECEVLGVRTAAQPPKEPHVEMEVKLFHEGGNDQPVFDSMVLPVSQKTMAQNYLAGQMRIGTNLAPGDYTMQLLVYDRLASPKKQLAVQWTNLTVVSPAK